MTLETSIITVPLAGGVSKKNDPLQVPPVKLLDLVNGVFDAPGSIKKRSGFLPGTNVGGDSAETLVAGSGLAVLGNEVLAYDNSQWRGYSPGWNSWDVRRAFPSFLAREVPVTNAYPNAVTPCLAVGAVTTCVVFGDGAGVLRYQVQDNSTAEVLLSGVVCTGTNPRVVYDAVRQTFIIFGIVFLNHGYPAVGCFALPESANSALGSMSVVAEYVGVASGGTASYDVVSTKSPNNSGNWAVAWTTLRPGGSAGIAVSEVVWSGTYGLFVPVSSYTLSTIAGGTSCGSVSLTWDSGANTLWLACITNPVTAPALCVATLPMTFDSDTQVINASLSGYVGASVLSVGGAVFTQNTTPVYMVAVSLAYNTGQPFLVYATYTSAVLTSFTLWGDCSAISRPWADTSGTWYVLTQHVSQLQTSFYLLSLGSVVSNTYVPVVVTRALAGTAQNSAIVPLQDTSSGKAAVLVQASLSDVSGNLVPLSGVRELAFTRSYVPDWTTYAATLILSGGVLRGYDGVSLTELGIPLFPEGLTAVKQQAASSVTDSGIINLSAPSDVTVVDLGVQGAQGGGTWYFVVTSLNAVGETLPCSPRSMYSKNGSFALSWSPVTGATGYRVYRSVDGTRYNRVATLAYNVTSYIDLGIVPASAPRLTPPPTIDSSANVYPNPLALPTVGVTASPNTAAIVATGISTATPAGLTAGIETVTEPTLLYLRGVHTISVRAVYSGYNGPFATTSVTGASAGSAIPATPHQILTVSWSAVFGADHYEVFCSGGTNGPIWVGSTASTSISVTALNITKSADPANTNTVSYGTGTLSNTTYYYAVSQVNSYGESVPVSTSGISTGAANSAIKLTWTAVGTMFYVYRGTTNVVADMRLVGAAYAPSGGTVTFFDGGITAYSGKAPPTATPWGGVINSSITRYYVVTSVSRYGGETLPSAEVSIAVASGGILLAWSPVPGAVGYNVYRGVTKGSEVRVKSYTQLPTGTLWWFDADGAAAGTGESPPSADTSLRTDAAYQYVATYEWTDANGLVYKSAPSPSVTVYLFSGVNSSTSVLLTVPGLSLTEKTGVQVVFYRTLKNGSVFYRLASVAQGSAYPISVTYTDTSPDTDLMGNAQLYTVGNVVENVWPAAVVFPHVHSGRLFAVDALKRRRIWYSHALQEGAPPEFSDLLTFEVDERGGDITGLATLASWLIIFKQDRIFYTSSQGPDRTGQGDNYSDVSLLPGDCGCVDSRSIAETTAGLLFRADKGIYLLDRSLMLQYVGADVEPLLSGVTVLSATPVADKHQVRFLLDGGTSQVLVYDYLVNQWARWSLPAVGLSAALVNGSYAVLATDGYVYTETAGQHVDGFGDWIPLTVRTAWIKLADLQRWQRTRNVQILGTRGSADFLVNATIYRDYQNADAYAQTAALDTFSWGDSAGVFDATITLRDQHGSAVQILLTDAPSADLVAAGQAVPDPDQGLTLTAFAFEVGLEGKKHRLTPSRRRY